MDRPSTGPGSPHPAAAPAPSFRPLDPGAIHLRRSIRARYLALGITASLGCGARPPAHPPAPHAAIGPESPLDQDLERAATHARRIVHGRGFACAILRDGAVDCWGDPAVEATPTGSFTALAAGDRHVCGLRPDRTVACWGDPDHGRTRPPAEPLVALVADGWMTCGLRHDMTAACWGDPDSGRLAAAPDRLRSLATHDPMTCGLRADGTVACWGAGDRPPRLDRETYTDLAIGEGVACGLRSDGGVRCGGYLGDAVTPPAHLRSISGGGGICGVDPRGDAVCFAYSAVSQPPAAPPGPYTRVVPGRNFACGLRDTGELACWPPFPAPLPAGPFEELALGDGTGCARAADGRIACFGGLHAGQARPPAGTYRAVAAGARHSCAIATTGALACWGADEAGQSRPPAGTHVALACGHRSSCAITTAGDLTCWGAADELPPAPQTHVRAVAMTDHLACSITTTGAVTCWGPNAQTLDPASVRDALTLALAPADLWILRTTGATCFGARVGGAGGGGATPPTWGPLPCPTGPRDHKPETVVATAVAVDERSACALDPAGALRCWSNNGTPLTAPLPPGPFTALSMRARHGCGLRRDGTLACWGSDAHGESRPPPGVYRSVAAGPHHACAIRDDDTLTCWGSYAGDTPL